MMKIKLGIVDDHRIFRNGLKTSLAPFDRIRVILEAESGEQLLEMIRAGERPDVVLMDIKMAEMDGINTTAQLMDLVPEMKVIALSVFENYNYITNMFKAGAKGYLLKDSEPEELVRAIDTVMREEYYFNDLVSVRLVKSLVELDHPATRLKTEAVELNPIDVEILRYICDQYTNAEIGEKLNKSTKTVENYRNRLLQKTGAKNTAGLVTFAIRKGYVVI